MAHPTFKVIQFALAFLALTLVFVSATPISSSSDVSPAVLEQDESLDIVDQPPLPPTLWPSHVDKGEYQQSAPPQETGGDGTIFIAREDTNAVYPRQQDPSGCVVFIARDGKVGTTTPPSGCPSPPAQKARKLPLPPQGTKPSKMFRMNDHVPGHHQVQRHIDNKPTFTTFVSPGLTTLTISASTGRETGGVVVITGTTSHKDNSSKTQSWVSPGTFTVTGGSGAFTVITTVLSHPQHTHLPGRIPPPEWLTTHVKTHVRPTDKPALTESFNLADRVPPPEWRSAHARDHPYSGTHVRSTDTPFVLRSSPLAKQTSHIHTMDKHTYNWNHKSETVLDPTHDRPTDKPAT
ncbi:hypothetical protein BKA64DRAFT_634766 [Cadophora sp. MPI-SDFR-AT-0126]|nr:hypothetical protein BKA64DRAFT_634766 [Leotiomycetes sp. MPI-SDFR-AT-0126]